MGKDKSRREPAYVVSVLPFGTTEEEFAEFATGQGYEEIRRTPEDRSTLTLLTVTYSCGEPSTFVQFVFNFKVHISTARSHGPNREAVANALDRHFYIVDESEIRTRFASDDAGDRGLALAYLAEFAPRIFAPDLLDVFVLGAKDGDPDVREFSYLAMGMVGWSQFRPVAEAALKTEKVVTLQAQLKRLIAGLS